MDQHSEGGGEPLEVTLDAGKTYFFIVDGSSDTANEFGAYTLEVIPPKSFASPIQLDVTEALLHDTVVNNGKGTLDPTQTSMDRVLPKFSLFPDDPEAGLQKDRIERRPIEYHERVRQNYLAQAKSDPARYRVVNADRPPEIVHEDVWRVLEGLR